MSVNYLWNEIVDRIVLNNQDEGIYYCSYMVIFICNFLLEYVFVVIEVIDFECNEVMVYVKVICVMSYYILVNYYVDIYVFVIVGIKLSVFLIISVDINVFYKQVII